MKIEKVNIGLLIEQKMNELDISKSELARRAGIANQNINRMLERHSIDTEKLVVISEALDFNFFDCFHSYKSASANNGGVEEDYNEHYSTTDISFGVKIKELASKNNLEIPQLAEKLGKSKQAVYDMISKDDVNTSILRAVAEIFDVPLSSFFADGQNFQESSTEKLEEAEMEIERLRRLVHSLQNGNKTSTRVVVELDVDSDEFVKMGLKDKVIQILNK